MDTVWCENIKKQTLEWFPKDKEKVAHGGERIGVGYRGKKPNGVLWSSAYD